MNVRVNGFCALTLSVARVTLMVIVWDPAVNDGFVYVCPLPVVPSSNVHWKLCAAHVKSYRYDDCTLNVIGELALHEVVPQPEPDQVG